MFKKVYMGAGYYGVVGHDGKLVPVAGVYTTPTIPNRYPYMIAGEVAARRALKAWSK